MKYYLFFTIIILLTNKCIAQKNANYGTNYGKMHIGDIYNVKKEGNKIINIYTPNSELPDSINIGYELVVINADTFLDVYPLVGQWAPSFIMYPSELYDINNMEVMTIQYSGTFSSNIGNVEIEIGKWLRNATYFETLSPPCTINSKMRISNKLLQKRPEFIFFGDHLNRNKWYVITKKGIIRHFSFK